MDVKTTCSIKYGGGGGASTKKNYQLQNALRQVRSKSKQTGVCANVQHMPLRRSEIPKAVRMCVSGC